MDEEEKNNNKYDTAGGPAIEAEKRPTENPPEEGRGDNFGAGGVGENPEMGSEEKPGGKPKKRGAIEEAGKKVAEEVGGKTVGGAVTLATGGNAVFGKLADWFTKKVIDKFWDKGKKKIIWAAVWEVLGPACGVLSIILATVIMIVIIVQAGKGFFGKSYAQPISATSSADMAGIEEILGNSTMLPGEPTKWWFSQGATTTIDKNGNKTNETEKLWGTVYVDQWGKSFSGAGCFVTSVAIVAKYYSQNQQTPISPLHFSLYKSNYSDPAECLNGDGSLKSTCALKYLMNDVLGSSVNYIKKFTGKNVTVSSISTGDFIQTIKTAINHGDPVIASIKGIWGATGNHKVVIIGISKEEDSFVISDPSADSVKKWRGSPARYVTVDPFRSNVVNREGPIVGLYVYHQN